MASDRKKVSRANQPAWFIAYTTGPSVGRCSVPCTSNEKYPARMRALSSRATRRTRVSRSASEGRVRRSRVRMLFSMESLRSESRARTTGSCQAGRRMVARPVRPRQGGAGAGKRRLPLLGEALQREQRPRGASAAGAGDWHLYRELGAGAALAPDVDLSAEAFHGLSLHPEAAAEPAEAALG